MDVNSMFEEKIKSLGGISPVKSDKFDGLSKGEITEIEKKLGAKLPDDYKAFLMQYGQVLFTNESVAFKPENKKALYPINDETEEENPVFNGSQVSLFFGKDKDFSATLVNKIDIYSDRMPHLIIPFADDGLGNKLCIGLEEKNYGYVYWWDHENEWDKEDYEDATGSEMPEKAKYQNVYLIAKSFSKFIEKLYIVK